MARRVRASDWIAVASEQATACRKANGTQAAVGIATVPFTPGTFALQTFFFWSGVCEQVFARAGSLEGGLDVGQKALATKLVDVFDVAIFRGSNFFMSDVPGEVAKDSGSIAVRQSAERIDSALRTMLDAMSRGSNPGTRNGAGLLCIDAVQAPRYWGAVATLGREYSFLSSNVAITVNEYWTVVKEGAKEGLRDVGKAAGEALNAAGDAVGAGLGGVLSGLGIVNTAVIVGGAYLVGREVL